MNKPETSEKKREGSVKNLVAMKGGTYSLAITAVVLAILVAVNALVGALPSSATSYDISSTKLYSITSNTKVVVNALEQDVTIYWVVQSGEENSVIENLLSKYESLSSHISVVKKNPDVYPTFAAQYTDETVSNNSLIVECGSKYRYIGYDEIYLTDIDYTTYSYVYSFDGEGALTSAISYVVSEDLPVVYTLEGHGEAELPDNVQTQIGKDNMEISSFSLVKEDAVPEDAACVLIYSPESDISEEEKDLLAEYAENGGKLLVIAGPVEDGSLTNLTALLSDYGVNAVEGIVVEGDSSHYAFRQPYILLPDIESSDITDPLVDEGYYAILPIAQGLDVSGAGSSVTTLLSTSDAAFSKTAGYSLTSYDKEDGDTDGPFALAVDISTAGGGEIVWISSSHFLDELYNAYSSGANLDLTMNALSALVGQGDTISIRSKSMSYNYLTISESAASMLKTWVIGVLPGVFVLYGIITVIERRRKRHA